MPQASRCRNVNGNPVTLSAGGNGQSTMYSGVLGGPGSLVKTGTGMLTLQGADSYTGGTQVVAGILQLGYPGALGTGGLAVDGGSLDLAGNSITVPSFSGAAGVVTNSFGGQVTLTVNQFTPTTFGGTINDGQGLTALMMMGGGTLTLSGTNTYTGGTSIAADGSVLIVTNNEALADGSSLAVGDTSFYFAPLTAAGAQAAAVSPVPEPGTLALMAAAGGIALLRLRRRARASREPLGCRFH